MMLDDLVIYHTGSKDDTVSYSANSNRAGIFSDDIVDETPLLDPAIEKRIRENRMLYMQTKDPYPFSHLNEDETIRSSNGTITAASLINLLAFLTERNFQESELIREFLLTYRSYCDVETILYLLEKRTCFEKESTPNDDLLDDNEAVMLRYLFM